MNSVSPETGQSEQTSLGTKRKTRTSAAMLGLALSMGTSGLLIPRQSEQANAAEPKVPEPTFSTTNSAESETASLNHVVRQGETLWTVSRKYRVSVNAIAAANNLTLGSSLKIGQVLRVPADSSVTLGTTTATQTIPVKTESNSANLVASSDLERLPIGSHPPAAPAATPERNEALGRLRQERERLMSRMAELRREEASATANQSAATPATSTPAQSDRSSQVARSTQARPVAASAYQVRPGDTVGSIARNHQVSPQSLVTTNRLQNPNQLRVNQALTIPAAPTVASAPANTTANNPAQNQPVTVPTTPAANLPTAVTATVPQAVPSSVQVNATQPTRVAVGNLTQPSSYRVNLGDTVASIARAHNIAPSMLVSANRLIDANVIFVGQVLRIPSAPAIGGDLATATPVAVRQPASQPQTIAAAPLTTLPTPVTPSVPVQPSLQTNSNPTVADNSQFNPYVQNLLTEVRALQSRHRQNSTAAAPTAVPVRVAARSVNPPVPTADSVRIRVPEARSSARALTPAPQAVTVTVPQPASNNSSSNSSGNNSSNNLVAVAPLGSESYSPLLNSVTGRTVSPELPALQNPDNFLPEGTPKFNGYIWPARGVLTSGYGWRWGRMHRGIDIAADVGTPIYSAAEGVVEYADWNSGGFGNLIEVRHADGSMTRYAHLNAIHVTVGARVKQGQQIGEMGSTGYSTGPHLHFEVHLADGSVNPMAYLPPQ